MLLFVVRHGDPIYDPDMLTPLGRLQAAAVAKRFAVHGLDRVFSSPVNRAKETAQPTCEMLRLPMEIEEWTSESYAWQDISMEFPDGGHRWVFARPANELKEGINAELGVNDFDKCINMDKLDKAHCFDRIRRESDRFLEKLGYRREGAVYRIIKPNEDRIALFCHQGFSMTWFPYLLNIPAQLFWSVFDISHSGVSTFEF